jgi:YD repeat-containing protein
MNACESALEFWDENKLEGMDSDWIRDYHKDPWGYCQWISKLFGRYKFEIIGDTIKATDMYRSSSYGSWRIFHFDENNNLSKCVESDGSFTAYEYDNNSNLLSVKKPKGDWAKYKYDQNNNLLKMKNSNGFWEKYKYDQNNNLLKMKDSDGVWENISMIGIIIY